MKEPAQISNPEYSVDRILARMKAAAARQGQMPDSASVDIVTSAEFRPLRRGSNVLSDLDLQPIQLQPRFYPSKDSRYHVNDLLKFHDSTFIQNAYRAILKRGPDAAGYRTFLESLRSARLNKIDILARLRYSAEGRSKQVEIEGLRLPSMIRKAYRVPYLGYLLNLLIALWRLPTQVRSEQQFEAHMLAQQEMIVEHLNHADRSLLAHVDEVSSVLASIAETAKNSMDQLQHQAEQVRAQISQVEERGDEANQQLNERLDQGNLRFEELRQQSDLLGTAFNELRTLSDNLKRDLNLRIDQEKASRGEGVDTLARVLNETAAHWQKSLAELETRHKQWEFVARLKESQLQQADSNQRAELDGQRQALEQQREQMQLIKNELQAEVARVFEKQQQVSTELVLQGERLTAVLVEARKRLQGPFDATQLQALAREEDHTLDAFYASFDEQFRGSRDEIKQRLRIYLPYIKDNGIGTAYLPILDVGSGRGEWLELLNEEGLIASGVDSNRILVEWCENRNLQVVNEDLLSHFQELADGSVGAVTGFHIIEHLPIETLVEFLNQTVRVLKPGGVVIFETPNPQNVLVGSCNFYFDPTHRNPLPSQVTRFLLESRGFNPIEVLNINPSDDTPVAEDSELARRFNRYFYGPMDYAVIGFRS